MTKAIHAHVPKVIGLTGAIASGKSTVAEVLREKGAEIIDADRVYRSLLTPGSSLWHAIVERFGLSVVRDDKEVDRKKLASIVFTDPNALAELDRITHPAVVEEVRQQISRSTAPVVVVEAVKLVQSGLVADTDVLWLVVADQQTRINRLMSRSGMDRPSAEIRVAAASEPLPEWPTVDVTIDNSGSLAATRHAVDNAWRELFDFDDERPSRLAAGKWEVQ